MSHYSPAFVFVFSDNDPWNPAAAAAKPDSFSPALRPAHSPAPPAAGNDPWLASSASSGGAAAVAATGSNEQSIDPFSPVAQNQLAEFDLLRDQMEKPVQPTITSNNGGNNHRMSDSHIRILGTEY